MNRLEPLKEKIRAFSLVLAEGMALELVELNVHFYNETLVIQVFVDRPTGGIQIDECTVFNHKLDRYLYEELQLGKTYTLEVSSPGLDRPLKTFADFRRNMGREMRIFCHKPVNGKREVQGVLQGIREEEILLGTKDGECVIPFDMIDRGKQIIG